ncbi:MAG: hypothetical protein KIT48_02085 [Pseudolabrys sp.]|jgi:hypothetical protein|nr:hypothetical protein [Pseudolabrys sp.]
MKKFEFSIVASGLDPQADDFEARFFDAGCDDATVSFQKGHTIVDFTRGADSLEAAISSAVQAVSRAGAKVDRVEPDPLVSLSEISARTGLTRGAMTHYHKGDRGKDFPAPVARVTSGSPLWDWAEVARWMFENQKIEKQVAIEAEIVRFANEAIGRGATDLSRDLQQRAKEYEAKLAAAA